VTRKGRRTVNIGDWGSRKFTPFQMTPSSRKLYL